MPAPESILANAAAIANEWRWLAAPWHLALALAIGLIVAGWRPSITTAATILMAPLFSVAAMAWMAGNPFNGTAFVIVAVALLLITLPFAARPIRLAPRGDVALGLSAVALGWVYPHFVVVNSPLEYLYESPFGLLPCPTLLVVAGLSITLRAFDSQAWRLTLATAAMLYGVIGVAVLGVTPDLALIAAGAVLGWRGVAWRPRRLVEGFGTAAMVLIVVSGATAQSVVDETPAVTGFIKATRDYAALHRRIEQQIGPLVINADPATIHRAVEAMANAMRAARADAKQGDFFTPALAAELRVRVYDALAQHGLTSEDIRFAEWLDGINPTTARLAVNGTFPWSHGSAMFPCVITALPPLPPELQYRVIGSTLVLIDVHASLIVDLQPDALAESTVSDLDCGVFRGVTKIPRPH